MTWTSRVGRAVVGSHPLPSALRAALPLRGARNPGAMPINPDEDPTERGRLAASISTAVVHAFTEHTGRGPTRARTTIDGDLVVVVLRDGRRKPSAHSSAQAKATPYSA